MKIIIHIACAATKAPTPQRAENMYISPLFKKAIAYAKSLRPDNIFILSAKHVLLPLDKVIEPYDKTLNDMGADEVKEWSVQVLKGLKSHGYSLENDKFIFLAGSKYKKYLEPEMKHYSAPMEHLRIGQQMAWLGKKVKNVKESLLKIKNIIYEAIGKSVR